MRRSERLNSLKQEFILAQDKKQREAKDKFEENLTKEIKKYQKAITAEINRYKYLELSQLNSELKQKQSQRLHEFKKEITNYRQEMFDQLFSEVEEKLQKFAKSSDYQKWLIDKISKICQNNFYEGGKLITNKYTSELLGEQLKNHNLTLIIDEKIKSGFIITNQTENIEINVQLELILKEQEKWFYHYSDLIL